MAKKDEAAEETQVNDTDAKALDMERLAAMDRQLAEDAAKNDNEYLKDDSVEGIERRMNQSKK